MNIVYDPQAQTVSFLIVRHYLDGLISQNEIVELRDKANFTRTFLAGCIQMLLEYPYLISDGDPKDRIDLTTLLTVNNVDLFPIDGDFYEVVIHVAYIKPSVWFLNIDTFPHRP